MSAGSPLKLFQSGWQGLVGIRRSGAAVLAPAPLPLVLADARSAAVLAAAPQGGLGLAARMERVLEQEQATVSEPSSITHEPLEPLKNPNLKFLSPQPPNITKRKQVTF